MNIRFFHGRIDPNQDMEDRGFDGPIVRNVSVGWQYGTTIIFGMGDRIFLPLFEDMIKLGDAYYGEWEEVHHIIGPSINFNQLKQLVNETIL
jgi:hypothetical protein